MSLPSTGKESNAAAILTIAAAGNQRYSSNVLLSAEFLFSRFYTSLVSDNKKNELKLNITVSHCPLACIKYSNRNTIQHQILAFLDFINPFFIISPFVSSWQKTKNTKILSDGKSITLAEAITFLACRWSTSMCLHLEFFILLLLI